MPRHLPYPRPHRELPLKLRRCVKPWLAHKKIYYATPANPPPAPRSRSTHPTSVFLLWTTLAANQLQPAEEALDSSTDRAYRYPYELHRNRILQRPRNPSARQLEEELQEESMPLQQRFSNLMSLLKAK
ncbi:uncharacterized protein LOC112346188 isoform X2 [Selaginella moellendorffii]|uniref:uncharacterized protein LOC112346188 isoform X2 n=1 Tax=Selaginella moellendorffii TaxID=88036 RepID=UPI000D1CB073|nr:uncharacterized protein LOC112346188 isoform X2 [Selaginella moellendorffii]|eukprot:XP_024530274.1 uncharacterized protein LOC112346188 isoform X2 [Selaginella moellendorffii]